MDRSLPPAQRERQFAGLDSSIRIRFDDCGVAHVEAASKRDAFFAQGYLVARDRFAQVDLERRQQLGRMAEVFGEGFADADEAARLFHFRGDIDAELAAMPKAVVRCVESYVAGTQARIDECLADPALLPPEYAILGMMPVEWSLRDMVRVRGIAVSNAGDEIRRAMLAARGLLDVDHFYEPLRPAHEPIVPAGLDLSAIGPEDLGLLDALLPMPFGPKGIVDPAALGSNAWTISGSRTASGRPILANDPHLGIGGFGPRHVIHLTAPGLDIFGAGAPGLPGIMQGHTDRYAFGRTNFHIDQTDLLVLDTDPELGEKFFYRGTWIPFEIHEEIIEVRGGGTRRARIAYANGNPVVSRQPDRNRAVAARTVSMEPGANMRFAIAALNLAKDWEELQDACRLHVSPTNFHYADVEGNIGWRAIGYAPRRRGHDGLLPVPGDGRYDWNGFVPTAEMPCRYNPEEGWIASANAFNVPDDYDFAARPLSYTWNDPYRHDRIAEVLSAQTDHSVADSIALMHDVQSLPARTFVSLIPEDPSPEAKLAADMLRAWDCKIECDSAAALLFEVTLPILRAAIRAQIIPAEASDLIPSVSQWSVLDALERLDQRLGDDPAQARNEMIDGVLVQGWRSAVALAGDDPTGWRWGDLHRVEIAHPLSSIPAVADAYPAIGGGRSGGDAATVKVRGTPPEGGWNVRHGASFLFAADVGDWDRGTYLLLPGQSLDPASPHYRDFYESWLAGEMRPIRFSRDAVDRTAVASEIFSPRN